MPTPEPNMPYALNGNGSLSTEAKLARLEAHFYHIWQTQNALKEEIRELKRDREVMLRKIGGWSIWALVAILSAVVSKGSTLGYLARTLLGTIGSSLG